MTKNEFDYQLKLLLIGDAGVGKTCVLLRYTNDSFNSIVNTTIGIDFTIKKLSFNKKRLKVQIWDTAGHESFRHITRSYYRGADAVMLLYDVTNRSTLDGIRRWIDDIMSPPPLHKKDNVICGDDNKVYKILIGCKCDLNSYRKITWEEGSAMAKEFKMDFFEVSAKTNYNIIEAFSKLYDDVMQSKYDTGRGSSIASSLSLISSDNSHHHHHHRPRQPSSKNNNNNNRSLREEMMSRKFQDHAVPIMLYGSSSWWNKVKTNGIYVPDCLHNYALREHRALQQSFGLFWYRNISAAAVTTVLVYEDNDDECGGGGGTWYVKDDTTILASISSNISTSEFELPHQILSTIWKERVRILLFFDWTTNSPNLKCIPYDDDDAKNIKPAADIFFSKAKNKEEEQHQDDDDTDQEGGYVNMDLFVEYSKHPESLGLTIPLFVRFCQVKISVL